jgi:hypothetical protein
MTYKGLCVFSIFALFTLLGTNQLILVMVAFGGIAAKFCVNNL